MLSEFSARQVTVQVLSHLERRRPDIAFDNDKVRAAVDEALEPVRKEYQLSELPRGYIEALEAEVKRTVPSRWQPLARDFTAREKKNFGMWRGGDPIARIAYVFVGLLVGGFILWAPFIPIWEKWFPFALAISSFFIPDLQSGWHRRRYARALGDIAVSMDQAQPALDAYFTEELLLSSRDEERSDAESAAPAGVPNNEPQGVK